MLIYKIEIRFDSPTNSWSVLDQYSSVNDRDEFMVQYRDIIFDVDVVLGRIGMNIDRLNKIGCKELHRLGWLSRMYNRFIVQSELYRRLDVEVQNALDDFEDALRFDGYQSIKPLAKSSIVC